jgi:hypothetical protein
MKINLKAGLLGLSLGVVAPLSATTMTFDTGQLNGEVNGALNYPRDWGNGVTGDRGPLWSGVGGGHLWLNGWNSNDTLWFASPTHVNSFDITLPQYQGAPIAADGMIKIAAFNSGNSKIWEQVIDLTGTTWANWLTINVDTYDVSKIIFYAPGELYGDFINPSVDNLIFNVESGNRVPDSGGSATVLLLGLGSIVLFRQSAKRATVSL